MVYNTYHIMQLKLASLDALRAIRILQMIIIYFTKVNYKSGGNLRAVLSSYHNCYVTKK